MACSTATLADDRLPVTVDIGDHHVTTDRLQDPLDFLQGRKNCCHAAIVFHRHSSHLAPAGTDRLQSIFEGQSAGRDQCSVFTQAVPHGHVGLNTVCG
jgi:hypothetical protein